MGERDADGPPSRRAVEARSWCRVDLAGGTLDIWPLGLLHPGAVTVNLAVDLPVSCRVSAPPPGGGYRVELGGRGELPASAAAGSSDPSAGSRPSADSFTRIDAPSPQELQADAATDLVGHLLAALRVPPVTLRLESASPRGAGLGASSALAVAVIAACEAWLDAADGEETFASQSHPGDAAARRVALARDVEARLMGLPTGIQDHWPGQLGGALAIAHPPGGSRVRRIEADLDALGDSLLVAYTGVSHFSAGQNWQVVRRRLDGEAEATRLFAEIARVAQEAEAALAAGDLARLGALVGEEWSYRRQLAPGVSVPEIEELLGAARQAGAWGGKACGAGGGGCVAVLVPRERRAEVAEALSAGGELLPLRPTSARLALNRL